MQTHTHTHTGRKRNLTNTQVHTFTCQMYKRMDRGGKDRQVNTLMCDRMTRLYVVEFVIVNYRVQAQGQGKEEHMIEGCDSAIIGMGKRRAYAQGPQHLQLNHHPLTQLNNHIPQPKLQRNEEPFAPPFTSQVP